MSAKRTKGARARQGCQKSLISDWGIRRNRHRLQIVFGEIAQESLHRLRGPPPFRQGRLWPLRLTCCSDEREFTVWVTIPSGSGGAMGAPLAADAATEPGAIRMRIDNHRPAGAHCLRILSVLLRIPYAERMLATEPGAIRMRIDDRRPSGSHCLRILSVKFTKMSILFRLPVV